MRTSNLLLLLLLLRPPAGQFVCNFNVPAVSDSRRNNNAFQCITMHHPQIKTMHHRPSRSKQCKFQHISSSEWFTTVQTLKERWSLDTWARMEKMDYGERSYKCVVAYILQILNLDCGSLCGLVCRLQPSNLPFQATQNGLNHTKSHCRYSLSYSRGFSSHITSTVHEKHGHTSH